MMKTLIEAQQVLAEWKNAGGVGHVLMHIGKDGTFEVWEEPTIKPKEMDEIVKKTCDWLLFKLDAWKIELKAGADGTLAQAKVTKRL